MVFTAIFRPGCLARPFLQPFYYYHHHHRRRHRLLAPLYFRHPFHLADLYASMTRFLARYCSLHYLDDALRVFGRGGGSQGSCEEGRRRVRQEGVRQGKSSIRGKIACMAVVKFGWGGVMLT